MHEKAIKDRSFANSLIIHEEKAKEITTVKEVWKCDPNYHIIKFCELLLRISPRIITSLRSYIKHQEECYLLFPNTSKLVKKNLAAPRFSNLLLGVWKLEETLFLVFDLSLTLL